jgi:hypothetical protein
MATFNTNYEIVNLTSGTYRVDVLGDNLTASTVHEIYCLTSGSVTISASGGGQATIPMTSGQSLNCMLRQVTVNSGTYIGFRSKLNSRGSLFS